MGFPGGSVVKNPPTNAGNMSSIPGSGRLNWRFNLQDSPGGGDGDPLQYPYMGSPVDRGVWGATVHGVTKELDTT